MPATVQYGSYAFSTTGRPHYGRKARYETDVPDTPATRVKVTYTVQHVFNEDTFADNQARWTALRTALQTSEGVLFISDENGTALVNQLVRVADADLPAQWGQHVTEVNVTFEATENLDGGSGIDAQYTPVGGAAIVLPFVTAWKEAIKADRYALSIDNRRDAGGTVLAVGKVSADPQQTSAQRRSYLQGVENSNNAAIDSKDGRLVYGSFDRTVRIDSIDTDLRDGSDYLTWSASASYHRFPAGDYAEADFTITTRDDLSTLERMTTVKGTVKADDEAGAKTKADAIISALASGRTLKGKEIDSHHVDGTDGVGWIELTFSADFRESIAAGTESFTLTISDKDDLKTGQLVTTYSGKVVSETSGAALTKARALGDGMYPIRLTATETVASNSVAGAGYFVEVTFSYEYLRKGARQYAEVTSDTDKQTFGNNATTTSGYAVATSEAAAYALARSFKPDSGLERSSKESSSILNAGSGAPQHNRVDFSYVFHETKVSGSIKYKIRNAKDYRALETNSTLSGTCWADTETNADNLIDALISTRLAGYAGIIVADERESEFDKSGTVEVFMSRSFSMSLTERLASGSAVYGDAGIVEATSSVETTYSVNAVVITPIPYGTPHVQTDVGVTPGMKVASGSVTALTATQALAWARSKIPSGGYADPYREKLDEIYAKGSTDVIRSYRVDFTYTKRFEQLSFP